MPPVFHAAAVAPRAGVSSPHAGMAQVMAGTRVVVRGGAPRPRAARPVARSTRQAGTSRRSGNSEFGHRTNCSSAPGLGFDEVHMAATCGPGTRGIRGGAFQSTFYFPFYDGGFYVPGIPAGGDDSAVAEAAQPDTTDADVRDSGRRSRVARPEAAPPAEPTSVAPADNDEFVFVRRDGTVFFAVAYSWEKGTLRYITSEGLRHTVTMDALDMDATRQFNEQRGLNFRLPA
jgi:nucleoid-associated protein YgaU